MTFRYIATSYGIMGSVIYASNTTPYHPKNQTLNTLWDMLKIDTETGKTVSTTSFILSPLLLPIYSVTIPFIYLIDIN